MQLVKMERFSKGHLKLLEESLQAQIAEFKSDFSDKDISTALGKEGGCDKEII